LVAPLVFQGSCTTEVFEISFYLDLMALRHRLNIFKVAAGTIVPVLRLTPACRFSNHLPRWNSVT
jgi:hypothetical protein